VKVAQNVENKDVNISKLHYISVGVAANSNSPFLSVTAIEDSRAQTTLVNKQLIDRLGQVEVIGSIKVRGVLGRGAPCQLVRLQIGLLDDEHLIDS